MADGCLDQGGAGRDGGREVIPSFVLERSSERRANGPEWGVVMGGSFTMDSPFLP